MTDQETRLKVKEILADPVRRQVFLEAMLKGIQKYSFQSEPHIIIDPKAQQTTN